MAQGRAHSLLARVQVQSMGSLLEDLVSREAILAELACIVSDPGSFRRERRFFAGERSKAKQALRKRCSIGCVALFVVVAFVWMVKTACGGSYNSVTTNAG